jgi:hypothetical protein
LVSRRGKPYADEIAADSFAAKTKTTPEVKGIEPGRFPCVLKSLNSTKAGNDYPYVGFPEPWVKDGRVYAGFEIFADVVGECLKEKALCDAKSMTEVDVKAIKGSVKVEACEALPRWMWETPDTALAEHLFKTHLCKDEAEVSPVKENLEKGSGEALLTGRPAPAGDLLEAAYLESFAFFHSYV